MGRGLSHAHGSKCGAARAAAPSGQAEGGLCDPGSSDLGSSDPGSSDPGSTAKAAAEAANEGGGSPERRPTAEVVRPDTNGSLFDLRSAETHFH